MMSSFGAATTTAAAAAGLKFNPNSFIFKSFESVSNDSLQLLHQTASFSGSNSILPPHSPAMKIDDISKYRPQQQPTDIHRMPL